MPHIVHRMTLPLPYPILPGHCDGGSPDDRYGGDNLAHVLRPLLLRPHDQPPPVQRDRHDGDRGDEDRGRLQQSDHSAAELKGRQSRHVREPIVRQGGPSGRGQAFVEN